MHSVTSNETWTGDCTFWTLSPPKWSCQSCQRQLLPWKSRSSHLQPTCQPAERREQNLAPASTTWPKALQTNTRLCTCFNYSLNVNMEETQEMTGWFLTFPPRNNCIPRAPTGRLNYQKKHTKKTKTFALMLGINYLTSWLKCKQEELKKDLLEVNLPTTFKENNLLKL